MAKIEVEWVAVDERLPHDGASVMAAVTGRYQGIRGTDSLAGLDFWLVLPMHFRSVHFDEDSGTEIENVFVDFDETVREPYGGESEEQVTHWMDRPNLPGRDVREMLGDDVPDAVAEAFRG